MGWVEGGVGYLTGLMSKAALLGADLGDFSPSRRHNSIKTVELSPS
jgi:hypothetical protein